MKVEIWSDVVCPFCYIGKRKFEQALENFAGKDSVQIIWRSFQLDPTAKAAPGKSVAQSLAEKKGWSLAQTEQMMKHVTEMAKEVGLEYHMEQSVVANTYDAHRLIHLAAQKGLQDIAKERLLKAYFTDGLDIGDKNVLQQIGVEIGLTAEDVKNVLFSDAYADAVHQDQVAAQQVGARGVPFFVFNNKYAISGAQPSELFAEVLQKVWEEEHAVDQVVNGGFCTPDGSCQ